MKTKLVLAFLTISLAAFAGGGDRYGKRCYVHDMDISHNVFYHSLDGELSFVNQKGKEQKVSVTSNISIYDVNTGKISYLFPDTFKETIDEFYFESFYDATGKRILFNTSSDDDYQPGNILGNLDVKGRLPSDKLFIITYSYTSEKYSLWTATKTGAGLTRVYEFSPGIDYYFDVKNMMIRFVSQVDKKIEIRDIKY